MDQAKDRRDERDYSAQEVAQLPAAQRQALKLHLRCPYCQATAHFRRASAPTANRRGRVEHFFCLPHDEDCDITRSYADPWDTDESDRTVAQWEQRNTKLVVRIISVSEEATDSSVEPGDGDESESRTRGGGDRTRSTNTVSRGPQKLLEQLVEWPSFKTSALSLRMPGPEHTEMPVHDAFVRFEAATLEDHISGWRGFWGIVRPLSYWQHGETYFSNFGAFNTSFRIAIHKSQIPAILARHGLTRIEDIVGHYLLLFDHARRSTSGRFIADVNSVNHIGFLRLHQSAVG